MKQRDIKMDYFKGILVFGMILCHVLQFFVNLGENRTADIITWYFNFVTFSGFIFSFGYTNYIAYFTKEFKDVKKKMILMSVKLMIAFYISGIAFRVLVDHKPISLKLIMNIVILNDIPGWSEFIVSFSLFLIVAVALFNPLKRLMENKKMFLITIILLLFTTQIPYDKITINQVGLFLGTTNFAAFPVLQFFPFYLIGMYFKRYNIEVDKKSFIISIILTGIGVIYMYLNNWNLPSRFPPSIYWVIMPSFILYCYYIICIKLSGLNYKILALSHMGRNSLVYLILSNILIFAISGVRGLKFLDIPLAIMVNIVIITMISFIIQFSSKN